MIKTSRKQPFTRSDSLDQLFNTNPARSWFDRTRSVILFPSECCRPCLVNMSIRNTGRGMRGEGWTSRVLHWMHFTERRAEWRRECCINVTKIGPCKINSQFDIFSESSSRILNLNLSNGGERNSMKLGFKISAHNVLQLNRNQDGGRRRRSECPELIWFYWHIQHSNTLYSLSATGSVSENIQYFGVPVLK